MWYFIGDRFVDANGNDVTEALVYNVEGIDIAWPVTVMHAPCHRYLDTEIVEQDGPEEIEFVANSLPELEAHQFDKL